HRGRVVTDALLMGAVADWRQTVTLALMAGADTLLAPQEPFALCDFLCSLRDLGAIPEPVINAALARQESMLSALDTARKRPDISVLGCQAHRDSVSAMGNSCLAWKKRPLSIPLRREDSVCYEEIGAAGPDQWEGNIFLEELRKIGINIDNTSPHADTLLLTSFSRPRAFSGSINLDQQRRDQVRELMKTKRQTVAASFGSPFVFSGLNESMAAELCAFSHCAEFQRAAARALCGYSDPGGVMPV
ncbi:MAG TPA: hypothetical protein PLL10_03755, partial [Elusimicrobiales bacterium]|nr:hypothetical protein [Elusimicrobiales bacterium]